MDQNLSIARGIKLNRYISRWLSKEEFLSTPEMYDLIDLLLVRCGKKENPKPSDNKETSDESN